MMKLLAVLLVVVVIWVALFRAESPKVDETENGVDDEGNE